MTWAGVKILKLFQRLFSTGTGRSGACRSFSCTHCDETFQFLAKLESHEQKEHSQLPSQVWRKVVKFLVCVWRYQSTSAQSVTSSLWQSHLWKFIWNRCDMKFLNIYQLLQAHNDIRLGDEKPVQRPEVPLSQVWNVWKEKKYQPSHFQMKFSNSLLKFRSTEVRNLLQNCRKLIFKFCNIIWILVLSRACQVEPSSL